MHRNFHAFTLLLILAGCSTPPPSGPPMASVKGTVTLDGIPIDTGTIAFHTQAGAPGKFEIKNGAYEGKTPIGLSTVVINTPDGRVPARYNVMPSLQAEVKPGENEFPFDLKAKKSP